MLSDYIKQCIAHGRKDNYQAGRYSWINYFSVVQRVKEIENVKIRLRNMEVSVKREFTSNKSTRKCNKQTVGGEPTVNRY